MANPLVWKLRRAIRSPAIIWISNQRSHEQIFSRFMAFSQRLDRRKEPRYPNLNRGDSRILSSNRYWLLYCKLPPNLGGLIVKAKNTHKPKYCIYWQQDFATRCGQLRPDISSSRILSTDQSPAEIFFTLTPLSWNYFFNSPEQNAVVGACRQS